MFQNKSLIPGGKYCVRYISDTEFVLESVDGSEVGTLTRKEMFCANLIAIQQKSNSTLFCETVLKDKHMKKLVSRDESLAFVVTPLPDGKSIQINVIDAERSPLVTFPLTNPT